MLYEAFWLLRMSREALSKILIVSLWSKLWNKSSLWGYWDLLWASMNPFRYFYYVDQLYTFCIEWVIRTKALICNVPANWLQHFKGVLTLAPKLLWHTKLEQTACCELVFVISKDGAEMFKGSAVLRHGVHSQSLFCSLIQVVLLQASWKMSKCYPPRLLLKSSQRTHNSSCTQPFYSHKNRLGKEAACVG